MFCYGTVYDILFSSWVKKKIQNETEKKKEELPFDMAAEQSLKYEKRGLGFKVFKLVKSNFPRVEFAPDPEKTEEENIELLKKYIKDKEAQLVSVSTAMN